MSEYVPNSSKGASKEMSGHHIHVLQASFYTVVLKQTCGKSMLLCKKVISQQILTHGGRILQNENTQCFADSSHSKLL